MTLPWWGYATLSFIGYAGTTLICSRLTKIGMSSASVIFCLFGFVLFAGYDYSTQANLSLQISNLWLLASLAITLFVSNFAIVAAYGCAPNAGIVKAIGT